MYSIKKQLVNEKQFDLISVKQNNIEVSFLSYGATIYSIDIPDFKGDMENILIQYKYLEDYIENNRYLNAIVGPTAGRIKDATFNLLDKKIVLDKNFIGKHNLHGGKDCFSFKQFKYDIEDNLKETKVIFSLNTKEEEQNYPGNQKYKIIYTVSEGKLSIDYFANTDKTTLVNLTNHAYFNLSGNLKNDILNHKLQINASNIIELDDESIPIKKKNILNTKFNYTNLRTIKDERFDGIDHPYLLDEVSINKPQIKLIDPVSRRVLTVYTTYNTVVCYTDHYPMKYELQYNAINKKYMGICFETQNPPNGINIDGLESSILKPNELYYHHTDFVFSIVEYI